MSATSLNQIPLTGGQKFKPWSGFSFSGFIGDDSTSVFVKCQIFMLWFIIIVFVIICVVGRQSLKNKTRYRRMNPLNKTLEAASEGFHILANK